MRTRITQRSILNQKIRRNIKRLKHQPLQWTNYGSKPYKRKRTTRRLKPRSIPHFLQKVFNEMVKQASEVDIPLPMRVFLRYQQLRC